jgi:hypothetical protein
MTNVASVALSPALTQGLDANFPDQPSDLEVHCQSRFRGRRVPLQPIARLGYTSTYIVDLDLRQAHRHHNVMGHLTKPAKSFS